MTGLSLGRSQSIGGSMWLPPLLEEPLYVTSTPGCLGKGCTVQDWGEQFGWKADITSKGQVPPQACFGYLPPRREVCRIAIGCNALVPQVAWHSAFQTGAGMGHTKKWVRWRSPFNQAVTARFVVNKKNCPSPMQEVSSATSHTKQHTSLSDRWAVLLPSYMPGVQQKARYFASVACSGLCDRVKKDSTSVCKIFSKSAIRIDDDRQSLICSGNPSRLKRLKDHQRMLIKVCKGRKSELQARSKRWETLCWWL